MRLTPGNIGMTKPAGLFSCFQKKPPVYTPWNQCKRIQRPLRPAMSSLFQDRPFRQKKPAASRLQSGKLPYWRRMPSANQHELPKKKAAAPGAGKPPQISRMLRKKQNLPLRGLFYRPYNTPFPMEMQQFFSIAAFIFHFRPCIFTQPLVQCHIRIFGVGSEIL